MKKRCIGSWTKTDEGICIESWEGGGIDDVAFKARYDGGYEIGHSCQDAHDKDVFHYLFIVKGSKIKVSCSMCGTECSLDPEAFRDEGCDGELVTVRLAPEARDSLLAFVLSRQGRAAGYEAKLVPGTKAALEVSATEPAKGSG